MNCPHPVLMFEDRLCVPCAVKAVKEAILEERERCAKIAESEGCGEHDFDCSAGVSETIRKGLTKEGGKP